MEKNDKDDPMELEDETKEENGENLEEAEEEEFNELEEEKGENGEGEEVQELNEPENEVLKSIAKEEAERIKQIKLSQKKALDDVRKEQNKQIAADKEQSRKDRLKFLIQQTVIFSHFMSGASKKSNSEEKNEGTKRGRKTEKEEDDEIINEALEESNSLPSGGTRLTVQPAFINGQMRDYQLHGLNWLIKLYENGINGILADEMGLGKTLQTIAFLAYLKFVRGVGGPHLVIAPKTTLSNWINEVKKWCPSLKAFKFHGNKEDRARLRQTSLLIGQFDICVTSYEMTIIEKSALKKFNWRYLIIDEAHRIKNEKSVLSQVVRLYSSQFRLLLTGTPLQNNLHELWALLNFLLPDVFSSSADFDAWFNLGKKKTKKEEAEEDEEDQRDIVEKLHKILRPFLLRRLKSDVETSLPPKKEIKLYVGLSEMQKEWYKKILLKDVEAINGLTVSKRESKMRLLNIVMQLRKACNHPYLFDGAEPTPYTNGDHLITNCGKMVVLDKLLPKLKINGSRVLIFCQMTRLLDILEDYLLMKNYEYCRIDGSTSAEDREDAIQAFNKEDSEKFIFLLSTRAGGLGINLATADIVILYDSDWNPQVDLQAQDRAHRIGQKKPVIVYRFVTEGAIEEKIVERAERKLHLDALVIQQGRLVEQQKGLEREEMLAMIKFGADAIIHTKSSTITDEDIDLILAKSEEKTAETNEKWKNTDNLFKLSLNDDSSNLYEFQGVDFSNPKKKSTFNFIEPPKRERKANYGIDEYYRNVLRISEKKPQSLRPPKQPVIYDFQFYPPRLTELLEKETNAFLAAQKNADTKKKDDKENAKEEEEESLELTPEEQKEKEALLEQGFGNWKKSEFYAFVRGCEKYGRTNIARITEEIGTKTEDEVKEYSQAFWKKYKQIPDWERIIKNIEKGESKLKRIDEMTEALESKTSRYKNSWKELKIVYGQNKGKAYTEEEDQFLVCMTHQLGYGNWEELKNEIRKAWQFRFDWFIKSRTTQELNRRVDTLIRLIEKENQEIEEMEGETKKRKRSEKSKSKEREKSSTEEKTSALSKRRRQS